MGGGKTLVVDFTTSTYTLIDGDQQQIKPIRFTQRIASRVARFFKLKGYSVQIKKGPRQMALTPKQQEEVNNNHHAAIKRILEGDTHINAHTLRAMERRGFINAIGEVSTAGMNWYEQYTPTAVPESSNGKGSRSHHPASTPATGAAAPAPARAYIVDVDPQPVVEEARETILKMRRIAMDYLRIQVETSHPALIPLLEILEESDRFLLE